MSEYDKDTRMWGMFCHLAALAGVIGIPLANIIGPLIIWLIKKESSPFIDDQGKESLNFQISMTIYMFVAALLLIVVIGIVLLPALAVVDVIFVIIAAIKTNNGESYHYPITIRFIK